MQIIYYNKYMIPLTQITNTEMFTFKGNKNLKSRFLVKKMGKLQQNY